MRTSMWQRQVTAWFLLLGTAISSAWADTVVGRTEATLNVSTTGEAQYTIPLLAPPGANGLRPQIMLSYGHRGGGSLFGVGWDLAGLSQITVCPRTWAQDGQSRAVRLDGQDRFCLDGQQLKLDVGSAAYGTNGAVYRTELESYSRITSVGAGGNTPSYFKVERKDGLIYYYGSYDYREDARIESAGTATAHSWLLTQIRDRSGNVVDYRYEGEQEGNGSHRLASVAWSGYTMAFAYTQQPANEIDFGYVAGGQIRDEKRATQVEVRHGTSLVRRYVLAYEPTPSSTNRSRLSSVTECGSGVSGVDCYPPTTFTYQSGTPGLNAAVLASGVSTPAPLSAMVLDVNGDGRSDLVYSSSATPGQGTWMVAYSNGTSFSAPVNSGISNSNFDRAVPIDYNADGLEDFLVPGTNGNWLVVLGGHFNLEQPEDTGISSVGIAPGNVKAIDVTGDGLEDLVAGDANRIWYWPRDLGGTFGPAQDLIVTPTDTHTIRSPVFPDRGMKRRTRSPDFNGDGHGDFAIQVRITIVDFPNFDVFDYTTLVLSGTNETEVIWQSLPTEILYADLNADNYTDVIFEAGGYWHSALSRGTGYEVAVVGPSTAGQLVSHAVVTDWDSDGYQDLLVPRSDGSSQLIRSNGTALIDGGAGPYVGTIAMTMAADVNGDNLDDVVAADAAGNVSTLLHAGLAPDLLLSATDGYGNAVNLVYTTLAQGQAQGTYARRYDAGFPYQDYVAPLYVVKEYSAPDGILGTYTISYRYEGAWIERQGRGFQSFYTLQTFDSRTGIKDVNRYSRYFPYSGMTTRHELYQPVAGPTFDRDIQWHSHHTLGTGVEARYAPAGTLSRREQWEVGGTSHGMLIRTVETSFGLDAATGTQTGVYTTVREHQSSNGITPIRVWTMTTLTPVLPSDSDWTSWCIGRSASTQQIQSHTADFGAQQTRTTSTTWDLANCRPTQTQVEPGDPNWQVTTAFEYDSFGNLWRETVAGVGMTTPARVTETTWGATGQFPHTVKNAANETSSQTWNFVHGLPASTTDHNGLTTTHEYDAFGRVWRVTNPDTTRTETTWSACGPGVCEARIHFFRVDNFISGSVLWTDATYFDRDDREVAKRRHVGPINKYVGTERVFDARGRIIGESTPYFVNAGIPEGPVHFQSVQYDSMNRPIKVSRPISATDPTLQEHWTYYEGLRTREIDAEGKTRSVYTYATGTTARSVDHAGYFQTFERDAFGNAQRVVDSNGNILQSSLFNVRGLRTASNDIDMGSWSYAYNPLGEMTSQLDAKGQVTQFAYDPLGRKRLQTEYASGGGSPSVTRIWEYGDSVASKNVGRRTRARIEGPGLATFEETHSYDNQARLAKTQYSEGQPGVYWEFDYAYNYAGQLETITYPEKSIGERLIISNLYTGRELIRVWDATPVTGQTYWQATEWDARLAVTKETLGNGLHTTRQFDAVNGLPDWIRTGPGGGSSIQNLNYSWDRVGNLKSRNDGMQGLTEQFTYDNLHRLTSSKLSTPSNPNGTFNLQVAYNEYGNITFKSGIGFYTYDVPRIHAVKTAGSTQGSTATGFAYTYDNNGNVLTKSGNTSAASVSWSISNKPVAITVGGSTSTWSYNADDQYWRQTANYSNGTETSIYLGGLLEIVTNTATGLTSWRHQIKAGGRTVAVHADATNYATNTIFPLSDHLGSTEAITDSAGAVLVRQSFTAFGARRGSNWQGTPSISDMTAIANSTRRGFTEHTMLDNVGFVHMNGRVYDPDIGRFLSADPYIQFPDNTQSWNRYSYVFNNPLSFTDPSGYFLKKIWKKFKHTIISTALRFIPVVGNVLASVYDAAIAVKQRSILGFVTAVSGIQSGIQNLRMSATMRDFASATLPSGGGGAMCIVAGCSGSGGALGSLRSVIMNAVEMGGSMGEVTISAQRPWWRTALNWAGEFASAALRPNTAICVFDGNCTGRQFAGAAAQTAVEMATLGMGGVVVAGGRGVAGAAVTRALPEALTVGRNSEAGVSVYRGMDGGKAVYSGITNDLERRAAEHAGRFESLFDIGRGRTMTRGEARAVEEALIVRDMGKNLRHSISPSHSWYGEAVEWGNNWLRTNGY